MRKELYFVFLALIGWQGVFMTRAAAQVTAEFSADLTSGCAPQLVEFTDLSTGNIDSWAWTLGDPDGACGSGPPSSLPDPGRIFTDPGAYCICLTVTDAQGNSDTECKDDFIQIFGPPEADIVANPTAGCPPVNVTFDDVSTAGSAPIVSWQWDLNNSDCQGQTGPTANCTYDIPGTYDISVIVTDQNGCQDFLTVPDMVTVIDIPDVSFAANPQSSCSVPAAVQFINTIPNSTNLVFDWDFGEPGGTSNDPNPNYTYNSFGDYSITLSITDTITGCTNSLTQDNFINIGNPVFFDFTPENGCTDLTVNFTDLTTNSPSNWQWDFGDGMGTSTDQNPSYTYTVPGCYTVTLTATNAECTGTRVAQQCIEVNETPTVSYNLINETFCDIPHTVDFEGFSNLATSWAWDFGDGNTSDQQNPSHTYTSFGTFPVTLTVTTAENCTAAVSDSVVTITDFNVNVLPSATEGCAPLDVTFGTTDNSNSPINSYNWDFGDPTIPGDITPNPMVTYADTGEFIVVLTTENDEGCNDTTTVTILAGMQLTPVFGADSTLVCASETVSFTDSTEGDVDEWFWEFGDGGTSSEQNPMYTYGDTGTFTVCLTVRNRGCPNTTCIDDYITILPPIALFGRIIDCANPFDATFEDLSIGATDWLWQFDANDPTATSTLQNPTYTYPDTGSYLVSLEVSNDTTGCTDMITQVIEIRDPMASFTVMPDSGCAPLTLMINNTSVDAALYSWVAPGADIADPNSANPTIVYNNGGTFSNIQLTVTDVNGCTDSFTFTDDIFVSQVIPAFDISDNEGCRPLTVQFTDQSTSTGGVITDWFWDLGDGLTSTDQNPTFTISNIGVRDVNLTVTNSLGCSQTITLEDTILVTFPIVNFDVDTLACPNQVLSFLNTSSVAAPATYEWDFGDNTGSTNPFPQHSYPDEGTYTVTLVATDRNGCIDSLQQDIVVALPIANFVGDTLSSSCPPQVVNFTDLSTNAFEWEWDFGDGSANVFGQNVQRIYTEPGVYTVCLYVNTSSQCPDTLCFPDYIQIDGPQGSFDSTTTLEGCAPFDVTFFGSGSNVVTYTWDDGAGGIQTNSSSAPVDSITITYNTPGIYFPVLSVADGPGCERSFPFPDPVIVRGISSEIVATDTVLCGSTQVTFGANIDTGIDTLQSIEWLFPGGIPDMSTDLSPVVDYDALGTYDVTLITSIGLCDDTLTIPDFIVVTEAPLPLFTWNPNQACDPGTIAFTDQTQLVNDVIDQWIWDFGTGDSAFVQNPVYVFQNPGTFDVNLTLVTGGGCVVDTMQAITINPTPTAFAGDDLEICQGEIVPLTGTGGASYTWSPAGSLSCSNCPDPMASPTVTTDYVLTAFTDAGCFDRDTVRITVRPFPIPEITLSRDTFVCTDAFVQLFADSDLQGAVFQWDTTRAGLSCYFNCFNPFATPNETTTYVVSVEGEGGCIAMDSVTVVVLDENIDLVGPDITICEGESAQLSVSQGNNPTWTPSIGLSCTNCPAPFVSPDSTQTYFVDVTTDNGCAIRDTINVFVVNLSNVSAGQDTTICTGEMVELNAQGPGIIEWLPDPDLDDPLVPNPIASPSETKDFFATFTIDQCVLTDTVTVTVRDKAEVFGEDVDICLGDTASLLIEGDATSFSWSPDFTLNNPTIANPLAFPAETTTYSVIGFLGTCEPDSTEITVRVTDPPTIELDPVIRFFSGQSVELLPDIDGVGGYTYDWTGGESLSCRDCPDPIAAPDSSTTYTLTVTDRNGCSATAIVELRITLTCDDDLIVLPNAFTPNGDGLNDVLFVRGAAIQNIDLFRIYDRWGTLVFETNNIGSGWDGTYKGQPLNSGVYVYYVQAPCSQNGSPLFKKGNVTLIR